MAFVKAHYHIVLRLHLCIKVLLPVIFGFSKLMHLISWCNKMERSTDSFNYSFFLCWKVKSSKVIEYRSGTRNQLTILGKN